MPPLYGTLTTLDKWVDTTDSIADREDEIAAAITTALGVHNTVMNELVAAFADTTSQAQVSYGGDANMELMVMDQNSSPDAQKTGQAISVGLPLRFYGVAIQWNNHFRINTPSSQLVNIINSAAIADVRNLNKAIRRGLLTPTNTVGYRDILATQLTYDLKALLNGDGTVPPMGENGETFDGTHNHYTFSDGLTEAAFAAMIENLIEHGVEGSAVVYINRAQEAAVRAFTDFHPYVAANVNVGSGETTGNGVLQINDPTNRAIGVYGGAEVWVRNAIAPADYQIAVDTGAGAAKALKIRTRSGSLSGGAYQGGFGTLFEDEHFPLRATALGREFGVSVHERHKAVANYSAAGATEYVAPTF